MVLVVCMCILWGVSSAHAGIEVFNLLAPGSDGYVNGAYFRQDKYNPTGTGLLDPFVHIQGSGGHPQEGYNTDGVVQYEIHKTKVMV